LNTPPWVCTHGYSYLTAARFEKRELCQDAPTRPVAFFFFVSLPHGSLLNDHPIEHRFLALVHSRSRLTWREDNPEPSVDSHGSWRLAVPNRRT
jgi:hypothetical protein